ncbi:MAG: RloB family protein [Desulfomonilaceae bacterium]
MGRKRRISSFRRKKNIRELRKRFLIICEGERTEPNYFRAFPTNKEVLVCKIEGTGYNTVSLVRAAVEEKSRNDYDEVWCVFDKDSFSTEQVNEAIQLANQNNIQVAFSNEAFELWYLLHYHYFNTAITRSDYIKKLTPLLGSPYKKNRPDMYDLLKEMIDTAVANANKLLDLYEPKQPAHDNPCTTVHLLVQRLIQYGRC